MLSLLRRVVTWCVGGILAKSSADGHGDELAGRSEPDEPSYQVPVRRLWPFGLRSRPPAGVEVIVVFPNGSPVAGVMVGAESAKYGPSDLEEGETAVYGAAGAVILLDKDGNVVVKAAQGKSIYIGDGAAEHIVLGDKFLAKFNSHVHATGVGPTATPTEQLLAADVLSANNVVK
ncbi:MAG TPA: phage baseplate assembly protein [Polyangiaceae bacterium]|nr:phage baseplate assembly protein [Polyangiaceae bacterium]